MRNKTLCTLSLSAALCFGLGAGSNLLAQDAGAPPAQAQGQDGMQGMHHGPMSPQDELQHLTKRLNLSSDEQTQILPILQNRATQLQQIHQDSGLQRQDKWAKMKSLDDDSNAKIEAVLNDQQKEKYEKMVEKRKEHMQQMHSGGMQGAGAPSGGDAQPQ
jgi:periplasmic protein CpxP/Spy